MQKWKKKDTKRAKKITFGSTLPVDAEKCIKTSIFFKKTLQKNEATKQTLNLKQHLCKLPT